MRTHRLEKALLGFQHRGVWWMAGMGPGRKLDGTWVYPSIRAALAMVGLDVIGVYIACRQNTVEQYIAARPMMELCLAAERRPGMRILRRWWEHTALDILGIRAGHEAADMGEGTETEELEGQRE